MKMADPRKDLATLLFSSFALVAANVSCVTVNVNFPESAVQKAADDYVRDLYRAKEKGKSPTSSNTGETPKPGAWNRLRFEMVSSAQAEESFKMDSPEISEIKQDQSSRIDDLNKFKKSGHIGEKNDGYVVILKKFGPVDGSDPVAARQNAKLNEKLSKLEAAENNDRKRLYESALKLNGYGKERLPHIQRIFRNSFREASPAGTPKQSDDGRWN